MNVEGACHCGNIRYVLRLPASLTELLARQCGCTFCRKHGGVWTSQRESTLTSVLLDESRVSKYRFATQTAEFYVCASCGVAPFVVSEIDGQRFAVVNVNTFNDGSAPSLELSDTDFEGEDTAGRLERRKRNWIPSVQISVSPP